MKRKTTAIAHPNLAFVKYWGKVDESINIPQNSSISVNLSGFSTKTSVVFSRDLNADMIKINGHTSKYPRVRSYLNRIRQLAEINEYAIVESWNDFPSSAGIASSASAFAALSLAASGAAGVHLSEKQLSILARKGSGSACRSIPNGFVEWQAGTSDEDSYASQIVPADYWNVRITTVIFSTSKKSIPSSMGQEYAKTSPFYQARLDILPKTLNTVRKAIISRDFQTFGQAVEREAIAMHCVAMSSFTKNHSWLTGVYYWQPSTMRLIQAVQDWREHGLEVYFTIDAGPNVHLLCERKHQNDLEQRLKQVLREFKGEYIVSTPARGAWIVDNEWGAFQISKNCHNDK